MWDRGLVTRPSIYEAAGGAPAMLALAAANHQRCLEDPVLEHPFSHHLHEDHVRRLGTYWGEVFGGPADYSRSYGGHSVMLAVHANEGMGDEIGDRFLACFVQAADDAGLPDDPELRAALRDYMAWAVKDVLAYSQPGTPVPADLATPRWSWEGLKH